MALAVARVPLMVEFDPDGAPYFRPLLPAAFEVPHGWGQASSEGVGSVAGEVLVWCRGDGAALDALARQSRSEVLRVVVEAADADRMVVAMRSRDPGAALQEFLAAYRAPAVEEEKRLVEVRRLEALVTHRTDSFNRANGALGTMSDGVGAWTVEMGSITVASNVARAGGSGSPHAAYDHTAASTARVRVSAKLTSASPMGVCARYADTNNDYHVARQSGTVRLRKRTTGTQTQLGSSGSSAANGDTVAVDCDGTSLSALFNGALDVGPVTDSDHAAGGWGLRAPANNLEIDDFTVEVEAASGLLKILHQHGVAL